MLIFLFIQNNAIDHIGGESKKRVSSEIGVQTSSAPIRFKASSISLTINVN